MEALNLNNAEDRLVLFFNSPATTGSYGNLGATWRRGKLQIPAYFLTLTSNSISASRAKSEAIQSM